MSFLDRFRPKWKHSDWKVAWDTVEDIFDERLLAKIAKSNCDVKIRAHSVEKLANQGMLAEIAKLKTDAWVRETAIKKLKDKYQTLLVDIAKNDNVLSVRKAAVCKLRDQAALAEIAKKETDRGIRVTAVSKLIDETLLADITKTDDDLTVRLTAVKKLKDQRALSEIAIMKIDKGVRREAVEKLADQALLIQIAKNEHEESTIREAAVKKLMDKGVLLFNDREDGSTKLLRWLLEHQGRQVRWAEKADYVDNQGEWTIILANISFWRGKYVFHIPRDYSVHHYCDGEKRTERRTTTTDLELPSDTICQFHVDGPKATYRCFYKSLNDEAIKPVDNAAESDYAVKWEFELLK